MDSAPGMETLEPKENSHGMFQAQVPLDVKSKSHIEFDITQDYNVRISGMTVLSDGRIIMCNAKRKMLLVYDSKGKYLNTIELVSFPTNIAVIDGDTDEKEAVISFEGERKIQFISISDHIFPGETLILLHTCTGGIATIGDKIAVGRSRAIDLYNVEGDIITSYESYLGSIFIIKYDVETQTFVLSDKYKCTKYSLDEKYEMLILECNSGRYLGIAVHKLGHIYVANFDKDLLVAIEKGGREVKSVLDSNYGICGPRALCFNSDCSRLYIANNDGQSIDIEEMEVSGGI